MSQAFQHVVLHGVGLLGASLGLALKKQGLAATITGVGRGNSPSLDVAKRRGAIDHGSLDLSAAIKGLHLENRTPADLVVLCTPIRQFSGALKVIAEAAVPGTVITDVGSTKAQVMCWAAELLPTGMPFIGSHPMAGSEKSGPEAARANLYDNAMCLLCAPQNGDPRHTAAQDNAFRRVRWMWERLGMRIVALPADVHDQWVATISHLPHAAAFALVQTAGRNPEMLQAVAGGFLDTTRVASSDVSMWTDIFLTNKTAVLGAIDAYAADLVALRGAIAAENEEGVRAILTKAKQTRDALLAQRKAAGLPTRSSAGGEDPA